MARKKIHNPRRKQRLIFSLKQIIPLIILTVSIIAGVLHIETIRLWFAGAAGENADIVIDTQSVLGIMPRPWRNLAQGGEDKNWRIQPILNQVRALNPEYIRIDHLYDFYDIVSKNNGQLSFHWEKIDEIVSDILATGAKPYLSLSYTPSAISSGDIIDTPANWYEYQQVIQKTVEHFSQVRAIENVIYEVWNEPDLFGQWKVYGDKNYLTLYSYAAHGAQTAAQNGALPFLFGGPATTALYENWVDSLLQFSAEQQLRLDFLSWHRYNRNISTYEEDIAKAQEWTNRYPQFPNLEFHITEWGHDSENDSGYDGSYSAAHTAAGAIAMMGKIQRAFVFEIQDGKDPAGKPFWGRWGLLTHTEAGSTKKSRYAALSFIDQIGNERLPISGNGSWVKAMASKQGDDVVVMLANYDPLSRHTETVPITFTNVQYQNFLLEQISMDNILRTSAISTTEAQLKIDVPMLPNTVMKLTLSPQP